MASFDEIYRELRAPVVRLCFHITGDRAAADDAAQEAFVIIFRNFKSFRGESKVSTWVYRIALHAALRVRARRAPEPATPEINGEHDSATIDPVPALEARDEVRRFQRALEKLSGEQRVVLSLFAIQGLSHHEIAEILGLPLGTVWSRLHLARKKLGQVLAELEPKAVPQ